MREYAQTEGGKEARKRHRDSAKAKATYRRYRQSEKGKAVQRRSQLKIKYNLTEEQFDAMVLAQGGRCAICRVEFATTPAVDHDRSCCPGARTCGGCIRGLLCKNCNAGIGLLGDDPESLERAALYLRRA